MNRKTLMLIGGLTLSGMSLAAAEQTIGYNAASLPKIENGDFQDKYAGTFYSAPTASGERLPVVFVGNDLDGYPVAFRLDGRDGITHKMNFQQTRAKCASLGKNWEMPSVHNLEMFHPYVYQSEPEILPGQFWTTSTYPCRNCGERRPVITYDLKLGGNPLFSYDEDFLPAFPICMYKIKN